MHWKEERSSFLTFLLDVSLFSHFSNLRGICLDETLRWDELDTDWIFSDETAIAENSPILEGIPSFSISPLSFLYT